MKKSKPRNSKSAISRIKSLVRESETESIHPKAKFHSTEELSDEKESITLNQKLTIKIEELRKSNKDFQNLADSNGIAMIFLDYSLKINSFNPAASQIFNLDTASHYTLSDITHQLKDENLFIETKEVLETSQPFQCETKTAAGNVFLTQILPYRTNEDLEDGIAITFTDITNLKEAEKNLHQSLKQLKRNQKTFFNLIKNTPFGIYIVDSNFRLIEISTGSEKVFSDINPLIGRDFAEILRIICEEPFASEVIEHFRHTLLTGESYQAYSDEPRSNIDYTESYDWKIKRITLPDSTFGVVCYFYDLTELRHAQKELRSSANADAFRILLADNLRPLSAPSEIQSTTGRILGEWLGANRVAYFEVQGNDYFVECDYTFKSEHLIGGYSISSFGERLLAAYQSGCSVWSNDVANDTDLSAEERAAYAAVEIGAYIGVPLVKEGEFVAGLAVHTSRRRDWTKDEIALVEEAAERTWAAVERARIEEALRRSEEKFRILSETAPALIWFNDADGKCLYVNQAYEDFYGKPIVGTNLHLMLHPEDADDYINAFIESQNEKQPFHHRVRAQRHDGEWRWLESFARPLFDTNGIFLGHVGVTPDITATVKAEQAVCESEERLRLLIESAQDYAIFTMRQNGIIDSWNIGAEKIFGWSEAEAIGQSGDIIFTPEDRAKGIPDKEMKKALQKGRAEDERFHIRKDGSRFFVSGVMTILKNSGGGVQGFVKIARDISQRLQAEKALQHKELLQKLVNALEDERRRIARDLHDELGQQLTALRLKLDRTRRMCSDDTIRGEINEIELIAKSIDEGVDFLAWELRPASLDQFGLIPALNNYVQQWTFHSGVPAEFLISRIKNRRFNREVETNLYRIVQEALNNTHKHAKAKNVEVILEKRNNTIVLIIQDDGKGFNIKNKIIRAKGIGLIGMEERAGMINGTLEIESSPGKGTTIFVRLPASFAYKGVSHDK